MSLPDAYTEATAPKDLGTCCDCGHPILEGDAYRFGRVGSPLNAAGIRFARWHAVCDGPGDYYAPFRIKEDR